MTIRLTPKRRAILDVLRHCSGTMTASDVSTALPEIDLATIYRNLDLFVKEKLIHEVHLDSDESHYEYQHEPHHHALCTDCHKVIHFTAPDQKIKRLLGLEHFQIDELEVTVRGICQKKQPK